MSFVRFLDCDPRRLRDMLLLALGCPVPIACSGLTAVYFYLLFYFRLSTAPGRCIRPQDLNRADIRRLDSGIHRESNSLVVGLRTSHNVRLAFRCKLRCTQHFLQIADWQVAGFHARFASVSISLPDTAQQLVWKPCRISPHTPLRALRVAHAPRESFAYVRKGGAISTPRPSSCKLQRSALYAQTLPRVVEPLSAKVAHARSIGHRHTIVVAAEALMLGSTRPAGP
jgi:hypothetical protein